MVKKIAAHCTDHSPDQTPIMVAYNRYELHWAASQLASSTSYSSLTAVKILSPLPRLTARPNLSSSQRVSLLSLVALVIRPPISDMSAAVGSSCTPAVSTATVWNQKQAPSAPYFRRFRASASRAACSTNTAEL